LDTATWLQVWQLLKQYGPVVALLLLLIYWSWRRIDKLLDRNAEIYETHIKQLYETQKWLMTKLIGPQPSSTDLPTIEKLKETAKQAEEKKEGEDKK
jgi:hypothetical protein